MCNKLHCVPVKVAKIYVAFSLYFIQFSSYTNLLRDGVSYTLFFSYKSYSSFFLFSSEKPRGFSNWTNEQTPAFFTCFPHQFRELSANLSLNFPYTNPDRRLLPPRLDDGRIGHVPLTSTPTMQRLYASGVAYTNYITSLKVFQERIY